MSNMLSKDEIVEIIVNKTGKSSIEINQMIEETVTLMDNMVNEDGAAFVVANKLGVEISSKKLTKPLKINQLVPGQSNISVQGRVKRIYNIRTFAKKDKTQGSVRNIEIIDNTGSTRVSLWDNKVTLIEEKEITIGDIIQINGASAKVGYENANEVTIGFHGSIDKLTDADVKDFPELEITPLMKINDITDKIDSVTIEGKVIDRQGIVNFDKGDRKGKVTSIKIADESGVIRITFWNDDTEKATSINIGDIIKLSDLRVSENRFGDVELTFRSFSNLDVLEIDDKYSNIEISTSRSVKKIAELTKNENNLIIFGKIVDIGEIRTFNYDGKPGKVANIRISDSTGLVRVNLWRDFADLTDQVKIGDIIKLVNMKTTINNYSGDLELATQFTTEITPVDSSEYEEDLDFRPSPMKLKDIITNRTDASFHVSITNIFDVREIIRSDGTNSNVLNMTIVDSDGTYGKIAAWNDEISKIKDLEIGSSIEILFARAKPGEGDYGPEITIDRNTQISKLDKEIIFDGFTSADKLKESNYYQKIKLDQIEIGGISGSKVEISGTIVQVFKLNFYNGCSLCDKKVFQDDILLDTGNCEQHGDVDVDLKMVLNLIIDDYTGTITATLFNSLASKILGFQASDAKNMITRLSDDMAPISKSDIKMKDITIKGDLFFNEHREAYQIRVNNFEIRKIDSDRLLNELEEDY